MELYTNYELNRTQDERVIYKTTLVAMVTKLP